LLVEVLTNANDFVFERVLEVVSNHQMVDNDKTCMSIPRTGQLSRESVRDWFSIRKFNVYKMSDCDHFQQLVTTGEGALTIRSVPHVLSMETQLSFDLYLAES
jgi:hypothetical protein